MIEETYPDQLGNTIQHADQGKICMFRSIDATDQALLHRLERDTNLHELINTVTKKEVARLISPDDPADLDISFVSQHSGDAHYLDASFVSQNSNGIETITDPAPAPLLTAIKDLLKKIMAAERPVDEQPELWKTLLEQCFSKAPNLTKIHESIDSLINQESGGDSGEILALWLADYFKRLASTLSSPEENIKKLYYLREDLEWHWALYLFETLVELSNLPTENPHYRQQLRYGRVYFNDHYNLAHAAQETALAIDRATLCKLYHIRNNLSRDADDGRTFSENNSGYYLSKLPQPSVLNKLNIWVGLLAFYGRQPGILQACHQKALSEQKTFSLETCYPSVLKGCLNTLCIGITSPSNLSGDLIDLTGQYIQVLTEKVSKKNKNNRSQQFYDERNKYVYGKAREHLIHALAYQSFKLVSLIYAYSHLDKVPPDKLAYLMRFGQKTSDLAALWKRIETDLPHMRGTHLLAQTILAYFGKDLAISPELSAKLRLQFGMDITANLPDTVLAPDRYLLLEALLKDARAYSKLTFSFTWGPHKTVLYLDAKKQTLIASIRDTYAQNTKKYHLWNNLINKTQLFFPTLCELYQHYLDVDEGERILSLFETAINTYLEFSQTRKLSFTERQFAIHVMGHIKSHQLYEYTLTTIFTSITTKLRPHQLTIFGAPDAGLGFFWRIEARGAQRDTLQTELAKGFELDLPCHLVVALKHESQIAVDYFSVNASNTLVASSSKHPRGASTRLRVVSQSGRKALTHMVTQETLADVNTDNLRTLMQDTLFAINKAIINPLTLLPLLHFQYRVILSYGVDAEQPNTIMLNTITQANERGTEKKTLEKIKQLLFLIFPALPKDFYQDTCYLAVKEAIQFFIRTNIALPANKAKKERALITLLMFFLQQTTEEKTEAGNTVIENLLSLLLEVNLTGTQKYLSTVHPVPTQYNIHYVLNIIGNHLEQNILLKKNQKFALSLLFFKDLSTHFNQQIDLWVKSLLKNTRLTENNAACMVIYFLKETGRMQHETGVSIFQHAQVTSIWYATYFMQQWMNTTLPHNLSIQTLRDIATEYFHYCEKNPDSNPENKKSHIEGFIRRAQTHNQQQQYHANSRAAFYQSSNRVGASGARPECK